MRQLRLPLFVVRHGLRVFVANLWRESNVSSAARFRSTVGCVYRSSIRVDECPEIAITVWSSRPRSIMRDSAVTQRVNDDPRVDTRSTGQERGDRLGDRNPPHLSVLRLPERHVAALAVVPAQRQTLADAGAGDQRELEQRLKLRHPLARVQQAPLLIG